MKHLIISLSIFFAIGILSGLSHLFNWYDLWFTDIAFHTIAGVGFAFAWIFLGKRKSPWLLFILECTSMATFGSVLWELGELGAWHFIPAYTPMYSPNFFDTIGDIACGMVGGFLTGILLKR